MKSTKHVALRVAIILVAAGGFLPSAFAQQGGEEEVDLQELIRQVRRNMVEVEKEIDQIEAKAAEAAAKNTREDLDELIKRLTQRGKQISSDIDEVIKNIPT